MRVNGVLSNLAQRVWQTTVGGEESLNIEISDRFNRPSHKGRGDIKCHASHLWCAQQGDAQDESSTQMLGKILYDLRGFLHDPINHLLDRGHVVYPLRAFAAGHQ